MHSRDDDSTHAPPISPSRRTLYGRDVGEGHRSHRCCRTCVGTLDAARTRVAECQVGVTVTQVWYFVSSSRGHKSISSVLGDPRLLSSVTGAASGPRGEGRVRSGHGGMWSGTVVVVDGGRPRTLLRAREPEAQCGVWDCHGNRGLLLRARKSDSFVC